MKIFFLLAMVSVFTELSSQNFTNRSVYDYSIGDTIITYEQRNYGSPFNSAGPTKTQYRVYTNKYYSTDSATIFYEAHDVYTGVQYFPTYDPFWISAANISFSVTNLDSSATNFNQFKLQPDFMCQIIKDTSYVNKCGLNEHFMYAKTINHLCFEPSQIRYYVIEGIGVFEDNKAVVPITSDGAYGITSYLGWYRKGSKRCGNASGIPDGISQLSSNVKELQIYPNPSNGIYNISVSEEGTLFITNVLGEQVYASLLQRGLNTLNFENERPGIYFAKYLCNGRIFVVRIVKR